MKYRDGQLVRLGDKVRLWNDFEGIVVCSLDTGEFSNEFPASQWEYLKSGVLIDSPTTGLIHQIGPRADFDLLVRQLP